MAQIFVVLMVLIMTVFSNVSSCSLRIAENPANSAVAQPSPTVEPSVSAKI